MMFQVTLRMPDIVRIFSKVEVDFVSGCWNWKGCISNGYGNVSYRGKSERVHRVIYAWAIGPILLQPSRKGRRAHIPQLDHVVCQNTHCCNPVHLELVVQRVNIMRGNGVCANYARMTHCLEGHPLPDRPNEKWSGNKGTRRCVPCTKARHHQAYLKRKK